MSSYPISQAKYEARELVQYIMSQGTKPETIAAASAASAAHLPPPSLLLIVASPIGL